MAFEELAINNGKYWQLVIANRNGKTAYYVKLITVATNVCQADVTLIVSGNTGYTVVVYSLYSTLKEKLPTTTLKNKNRTTKLPDQTIPGPNG